MSLKSVKGFHVIVYFCVNLLTIVNQKKAPASDLKRNNTVKGMNVIDLRVRMFWVQEKRLRPTSKATKA